MVAGGLFVAFYDHFAAGYVDFVFQLECYTLRREGVVKVAVKTGKGELTFANRDKMMRASVFEALSVSGDRVSAASDSYGVVFVSADFLQKERLMNAIKDFLLKIQP